MPQWVAVLFWIWVAVSLIILVVRRVRARRTKLASGKSLAGDTGSSSTAAIDLLAKEWPAPPPPEEGDDTYRIDTDEAPAATAGDPDTDLVDSTTPPPTTVDAAHSEPPTSLSGAPTLPELLAGITLPHELVPLTQLDADIDLSSHIIVATEKARAEVVRDGLVDELERLGYEIEHETMMHLIATGPRGRVLIDVHPDGPRATEAGVARFPTALEGSVVVELRVG